MKKYLGIIVISLALLTLLTGCNPKPKPAPVFNGINGISNATSVEDLALIKQALIAKTKWAADKTTVNVVQNTGDHTRGGVAIQDEKGASGAIWFGVRGDDKWNIIWAGNGNLPCAQLKSVGFPDAMTPECR